MSESIFKTRTLDDVYDEIRRVYLGDNRPWIIGFSGGKDSTCMLQMVWYALSELPVEKLQKKIYVISSDTLVETPKIVQRILTSLDNIEKAAKDTLQHKIHVQLGLLELHQIHMSHFQQIVHLFSLETWLKQHGSTLKTFGLL